MRNCWTAAACASGVRLVNVDSSHNLPCIRRRHERHRLRGRGHLARNRALRKSCAPRLETVIVRWYGRRETPIPAWSSAQPHRCSYHFVFTVTNAGGAGKSRSHMSWCTPWKYQRSLPVSASSAKIAIGEQIVSNAVAPVEIKDRGSRGHVDNAALLHRAPSPPSYWRRPRVFHAVFGPGIVTRLSRMREWYGTASAARRCERQRRECHPAAPAASPDLGRRQ